MELLLKNRFYPITSCIGFLETDMDTATAAFLQWQEGLLPKDNTDFHLKKQAEQGSLENLLPLLLPLLSRELRKHLFVATKSNWIAYFNNKKSGTDAASVIGYLPTQINCRGLIVKAILNDPAKKRPGAIVFDMYGPQTVNYKNNIRTISLLNDSSKWEFFQQGEPFNFEETDEYNAPAMQDRFTFSMLTKYLSALGLHPFDENFYMPAAVLIEKEGPLYPGMQTFMLEDVNK